MAAPNAKLQQYVSTKTQSTPKYTAVLDAVKSQQEDDQGSLESIRIKWKKYMSNSTFGTYYENYILFVSILSMFEFIYQTYLEDEPDNHEYYRIALFCQLIFAGIFILDWCLNCFLADHRWKYITSFFSLIDILTIIAILVTYKRNVPRLYIGNTLQEILLYTTFLFLRVRILRALRLESKLLAITDAVDRFLAEIALYATVLLLFFASVTQFLEHETLALPFHTWIYYIWATVGTIGYGDITPISVAGRFAAMSMISFALISVPKVTNELIAIMSLQSSYMRAIYTPQSKNSKHIVVCGDLSSTSLQDFFGELFHEDHENVDLSVVILLPQAPTVEFILLMRNPQYLLSVNYLEGSALVETDLKRAKVETAQAMFIMSNKFNSNSDEEDAKSILLNLSIKRYLAAYSRLNMLYCMQLIRPENKRHLAEDEITGLKENDLVVCLNEIKMGAMAKAVMYPGANTLLMNLVSSFSDDTIEFEEEDNVSEEEEGRSSSQAWLKEYQQGCGWEIYTTSLSTLFKGAKFSELSYSLYDKVGVVLFALQIIERETKISKLFLNPADFIIPDQDKFMIEAFVIAENKASSDLSFSTSGTSEKANHSTTLNESAMGRMQGTFVNLIKSSITIEDTDETRQRPSFVKKEDIDFKINLVKHSSSQEKITKEINENVPHLDKTKKKASRWKQLKRSQLLSKKVEVHSYQEVLHKLETEHFTSNYYVQNPPLELIQCTVKTGVIEELPFVHSHTIVIGKGLRNLYDLIRPLRAKYLGPLRYIVILFPQDIPHEVWQRISVFDGILFVRGSPLEESNLRRAGIFRAAQVVALADGKEESHGAHGMEALVDSDAIFTYQHVKRMNPNTQVVIEIINQSNIAYLNDEAAPPIDDPKFSPQFAAGSLFTTSLLDSIICQAYYNPQIIKVVSKLISGVDQAERAELAAKASDQIAQEVAAAKDADDSDDDDGTMSAKNIKRIKEKLNSITGSCLYQISLPEGFGGKTYGALYQHLAMLGMIPLGLFRGILANMNMGPKANRMPYVFTNPSKETELFSCDRVFVLATTPQRVTEKVDMKDWLLDIQMQQMRQQKEVNIKGEGGGSMMGMTGSSHQQYLKGLENYEKLHKQLDERFTKLSLSFNKKLNSIEAVLQRILSAKAAHNLALDQQITSSLPRETSLSAASISSAAGGGPSECLFETSRSRNHSITTIRSHDLAGIQQQDSLVQPFDSLVIDDDIIQQPVDQETMISVDKYGVRNRSFLKRVTEVTENSERESTNRMESSPVTIMQSAVLDEFDKEIPVAIEEIFCPESQDDFLTTMTPKQIDKILVTSPISLNQSVTNAALSPLQGFNISVPQISSPALKQTIEMNSGPSLSLENIRFVRMGNTSPVASSKPEVRAAPKEIAFTKTDVTKNHFADTPCFNPVPGPGIDILNFPNTDRIAKIRALKVENGTNGPNSFSRPVSASANNIYDTYTVVPFDKD